MRLVYWEAYIIDPLLACKNFLNLQWNIIQHQGNMIWAKLAVVVYLITLDISKYHASKVNSAYRIGPADLELYCVVLYGNARVLTNVQCALLMSSMTLYNYAYTIRDGRCYTCRTADALGQHWAEEQLLQGPHLIKGVEFSYIRDPFQ